MTRALENLPIKLSLNVNIISPDKFDSIYVQKSKVKTADEVFKTLKVRIWLIRIPFLKNPPSLFCISRRNPAHPVVMDGPAKKFIAKFNVMIDAEMIFNSGNWIPAAFMKQGLL